MRYARALNNNNNNNTINDRDQLAADNKSPIKEKEQRDLEFVYQLYRPTINIYIHI